MFSRPTLAEALQARALSPRGDYRLSAATPSKVSEGIGVRMGSQGATASVSSSPSNVRWPNGFEEGAAHLARKPSSYLPGGVGVLAFVFVCSLPFACCACVCKRAREAVPARLPVCLPPCLIPPCFTHSHSSSSHSPFSQRHPLSARARLQSSSRTHEGAAKSPQHVPLRRDNRAHVTSTTPPLPTNTPPLSSLTTQHPRGEQREWRWRASQERIRRMLIGWERSRVLRDGRPMKTRHGVSGY